MKKTFTILPAIAMLCLGFGCNNDEQKQIADPAPVVQSDTVVEAEHEHSSSDSIELNDGKKWVVVPDMMKYIRTMESDINNFSETEKTELKDYKVLGEHLQQNINLLTSNCTMEGKGHDELHKWLVPFIGKVEELNKAASKESAALLYKEIKASYSLVNTYFE